jgi:hypothetical protein
MNLHAHDQEFKDAIVASSQKLSLPDVFVEKDYWVTWVLWNLSRLPDSDKFVFKGGTALSKAYKLIDRFSEDIDLAVLNRNLNGHQMKKLISAVGKKIAAPPLCEKPSEHTTKGSAFRKVYHSYPKVDGLAGPFGQASSDLLIEISSFGNPTPFAKMPIQSFIGQALGSQVDGLGLESFEVNVLGLERTFAEKIMALVRASYEGDRELRSKVRHFYDLIKMYPRVSRVFFEPGALKELVEDVLQTDRNNPRLQNEWLERPVGEAPLFSDLSSVLEGVRSEYSGTQFGALVVGELPSLDLAKEILENARALIRS